MHDFANKSLLTYINAQCSIAAQFRAIRNNMNYASNSNTMRSIVITSPNAREGKTTVAVNLAVSQAQRGDKVLIMDANIQSPILHDIFSVKVIPGLTNVLAGQTTIEE